MAQLKVDLALDNVDNTSDDTKNSATKTLTNKTVNADNNTISNLEVDNLKTGVLDTDLTTVSASDDTIPSAKATKTALDGKVSKTGDVMSGNLRVDGAGIGLGKALAISGDTRTLEIASNSTINGGLDNHTAGRIS